MQASIDKAQLNARSGSQLMLDVKNNTASNNLGVEFSQVYEQQKPVNSEKQADSIADVDQKQQIDQADMAVSSEQEGIETDIPTNKNDEPQQHAPIGFSYSGQVNFLDTYLHKAQVSEPTEEFAFLTPSDVSDSLINDVSQLLISNTDELGLIEDGLSLPSSSGKALPLSQSQIEFIGSAVQSLLPGEKLGLQLTEKGLQISLLNPEQQVLKQTTLTLDAEAQKTLAESHLFKGTAILLSKNSYGELMHAKSTDLSVLSPLLTQQASELIVGKELLQPISSATTSTAPSVSALSPESGLSYRVLDGQLSASSQVNVPVGKPGWGEHINQQVAWFSSKNIAMAEIKLDPPDLGPLHIKISNNGDQTSITFSSPHAQVRDALDQSLPRLREMLSQQGVDVANVDVGGEGAKEQNQQTESFADNESRDSKNDRMSEEGMITEGHVDGEASEAIWHGNGLINEVV